MVAEVGWLDGGDARGCRGETTTEGDEKVVEEDNGGCVLVLFFVGIPVDTTGVGMGKACLGDASASSPARHAPCFLLTTEPLLFSL